MTCTSAAKPIRSLRRRSLPAARSGRAPHAGHGPRRSPQKPRPCRALTQSGRLGHGSVRTSCVPGRTKQRAMVFLAASFPPKAMPHDSPRHGTAICRTCHSLRPRSCPHRSVLAPRHPQAPPSATTMCRPARSPPCATSTNAAAPPPPTIKKRAHQLRRNASPRSTCRA